MKIETSVRYSIYVIAAVAFLLACALGEEILAPMVLALVIGIVLSPISDRLMRLGLPKALTALASLLIILVTIGLIALVAEPMVRRAAEAIPRLMNELNLIIYDLRANLRGIEEVGEEVSRALGAEDGGSSAAGGDGEGGPKVPSVQDALIMAPALASQLMIFVGTLFFFQLSRRDLYSFLERRLRGQGTLKQGRLLAAERVVSRYFLTISMINGSYAIIVSILMSLIGLPSPILWGIAAGLLNFVLYLGPLAVFFGFLLSGILHFEGAMSLAPAAIYLALNILESQFVTPALLGVALAISPLAIFLSLVVFLWLWGPLGGIVAIPLMIWVAVLSGEVGELEVEEAAEPKDAAGH